MKRFFVYLGLALLLMVVLSIGLCANAEVYSGECGADGDNLTWSLDTETGVLNISGEGAMKDYSYYSKLPWYSKRSYVKIVSIADNVTSIGDYAFSNCANLTSVTIPESVTSIGEFAFSHCASLTSITIPDNVTSIRKGAFSGCTSLTSITIPDNVTSIGIGAFSGCTSLTSITIPDRVTSIGNSAFYYCTSLKSVTLGNSITSIDYDAFSDCTSLTSITIPDSVTSIGDYAFRNCTSLTRVDIPESVISIGTCAFMDCSFIGVSGDNEFFSNDEKGVLFDKQKATLIQYPNGILEKSYDIPNCVRRICNYAFAYCTSLTSITIPDSVTSIGYSAFASCDNLKDIYYDGVQSQFVKIEIETNNSDFNSATVHYTGVSVTGVTLNETEITLMEGETSQLVPTISPDNASDKSVLWSSSNSTVATVIDGVVTAVSAGNANITVTTSDGGFSAVCQVTVKAPPTILVRDTVLVLDDSESMSGAPLTALKTAAKKFCKSVLESNGTNRIAIVVFASSVSYIDFTDDCDTLASKIDKMVASGATATHLALNQAETLLLNSTADVKSVVLMTDGQPDSDSSTRTAASSLTQSTNLYTLGFFHDLSGTSKDNAVALLNEIQNAGYYEVTDPDNLGNVFDDIATNITKIPVESITLDKDELVLIAGQSTSLNYSLKPHDATNQTVYWTSSNPAIATVSTNGTVKAIAEGKVTISARTADGNLTAQCILYVNSIDAWYYTYTLDDENQATITGYRDGLGTEIVIPAYVDHYPIVSIGEGAFFRASFTSVVIPYGVTSIGHNAFSDCKSLTSINISNSVTSIDIYAFSNCKSLTSIIIPNSVTSIGYNAFEFCESLTSINIPDSVTSIGYNAFEFCESLESITVAQDNEHYSSDERGVLFNKDKTKLIQYPIGNTAMSYSIPDSVTSIGSEAFENCTSLTSINIPNSVRKIDYEAFYHCTSLISITLPDSVTSIGSSAFKSCTSLTSITVAQDNEYYSNDERGALFNKDKTTLIQYPIGNTATSYDIPNSVTSIGESAFSGSTSLASINIPDSVTSIGEFAFSGSTRLTSIIIPNSVKSIGGSAFHICRSLTSITIPDSVISIGSSAFSECTSLTIYSKNPTAQTYATNNSHRYFSLDSNSDGNFTHADIEAVAKHISNTNNAIAMPTKGSVAQTVTLSDLRAITSHLIYLNQTK